MCGMVAVSAAMTLDHDFVLPFYVSVSRNAGKSTRRVYVSKCSRNLFLHAAEEALFMLVAA